MIRERRRRLRAVAVVLAVAAVAAALPGAARAHATLVASTPQAGARLASPPERIVLRFDEAYVPGSQRVSVRRTDGAVVALPPVSGSGARIVQGLPGGLRGIFVVSWSLLSDDGHLVAGDFAFSVATPGAIPASSTSSSTPPRSDVFTSWLFFVGLALALGGLLSERLVWRAPPVRAPVLAGIGLAALSSAVWFVLLAGDRENGGVGAGLHGGALRAAAESRPGALTLGVIGLLAAAAAFASVARLRTLALLPLAAAGILVAVRGHAGTSGDWWAPVADSVHLLAAAAWTGALAHLVLVLLRAPEARARDALPVRRYSELALPTVLVVLATGILTALAEFRNLASVLDTAYGKTLLVKALLVAAALGLALGSRLFALRGNPGVELPLLRRLTLGELAAVVAVLAAAGLLVNLPPPRTTAAATASGVAPASASGPALRLAGFAGRVGVALAVTRQELEFVVLPPGGGRPKGFELTAEAERRGGTGTTLYPRSCGDGCFAIRYRLRPGTTTIAATVASPSFPAATVRFAVPGPLPPARPELLRRMKAALRDERSVTVVERLSAGPGTPATTSTFHLTGPGFLAADPLESPVDVRVLGVENGLTELSFAAGDGTAWYRAWIDAHERLRRERIVRPGILGERTISYGAPLTEVTAPGPVARRSIPTGPFVLGREAGDLALGLAARPAGAGRLTLTTTVLGQDGDGATGLDLRVRLRSRAVSTAQAAPCGAGCYAATLAVTGAPRTADVTIRRLGRAPATVRFPFPSRWPPPSATRIAARATRVFAGLRSLTFDERLGSNATNVQHTIWRLQAPNRLSYSIEGGEQAIVVDDRRWDRSPGTDWVESPQQPVKQPTPTWGAAPAEAALLGSGSVRGRPVWRISFVDRSVPAWYTISVDRQTGRTLELEMTAAAHFMHHLYSGFDEPLGIAPPR